jgi:hypothetical protein
MSTVNRLPVTIFSALASIAIVASLAGCAPASSDGSGTNGGGAGTSGSTAAPSTKPAPVGSSDGACKYLSIADLDSITGRSYSTSTNVPLRDPIDYSYCEFKTTGKAEFALLVSTSDPADVMSVENQAAGNSLVPLAGVGTSALRGDTELVVAYGEDVIGASDDSTDPGMRGLTLAQLKAIVAKAHSAM